ncbi:MAG TPA: gamma-glutamyltransferase [Thermoleophilaceae bacterium]|nr:gamma-glutamyltransferase [Thermoleophilaceae bacterium]
MKGVVAAGHPLTAEAGADALRAGGNAVDAALAAMLMSWVAESPLTGPGAGGFMLIHTSAGETHLLDFFVAAPGKDAPGPPGTLEPIEVRFSEDAVQVFHIGPASCGAYGNPLGVAVTAKRFGSMSLAEIAAPAARAARDGIEVSITMRQFFEVLSPILTHTPEGRAIYAPDGRLLDVGERIRMPDVGDLIERLGAEGPAFLYEGDTAHAVSDWVQERGGSITTRDLAEYRVVERRPALARYHGREILTNPPPSSGGILIAYSLDLMERLNPAPEHRLRTLVRVMDRTNRERTRDFVRGLHSEGYLERFLAQEALESAEREVRNPLGNTTHLSVMDANGACVSVTCSNGSCSGVVVPGTGVHLNNMLGEEDLNPQGHRHEAGARVPSMMAPTVVLLDGEPELAVGSAGSNRIRSAILQTVINVVDRGRSAQDAVDAPRLHYENGVVEAEAGINADALEEIERDGWRVVRWRDKNLYFGGVQAVARHPETGALSGGGDPRRGGVAVVVD